SALKALFLSGRFSHRVAKPRGSFSICTVVKSVMTAPGNLLCSLYESGGERVAVPVPSPPALLPQAGEGSRCLHPEHAELGRLDGRVEAGGQGQAKYIAGLRRVDHPVVPQAGAGVVGVGRLFVLGGDGLLDARLSLLAERVAGAGRLLALNLDQHAGRLTGP